MHGLLAQNTRAVHSSKRVNLLLALVFALPCIAAQAAEVRGREAREPIVLNGQLRTSDFTGGVGRPVYDAGYGQASVYFAGTSNNPNAATVAFIGAARNQGLGGASMSGFGRR